MSAKLVGLLLLMRHKGSIQGNWIQVTSLALVVNMTVLKMSHLYLILDYPTKSVQPNPYNTCLKYFNVRNCQKPCWNQDMLQQRPVTHPQDMLHVHKRKSDWLSWFVIEKSFRAVIFHLSDPHRYFAYLFILYRD